LSENAPYPYQMRRARMRGRSATFELGGLTRGETRRLAERLRASIEA